MRSIVYTRPLRALAAMCALLGSWLTPGAGHAQPAAEPAERPERTSLELGLHGIAPLVGYADHQIGAGVEAGVGVSFDRVLVLATLGIRHAVTNDDDTFTHVPIEANVAYLISDGDATPFIGGGIGLYYLFEQVHVSNTVGTVLRSTSQDLIEDSVLGAGVFARAGALFLRGENVSWLVAVDYAVTFADFQERSSEHAVRLNVIALVGGR